MPDRNKSIVFKPGRIGHLQIRNRLIRSSTFEHAATEGGEVSETLMDIHRHLARGGIGLIMTGITWIHPRLKAPPMMIRADDDAFIPGLRRLTQAVHETAPDCKIMLQLHHPGRQVVLPEDRARMAAVRSRAYIAYVRKHPDVAATAQETPHVLEPIAPSAIRDELFDRIPRAVTPEEIEEMAEAFAEGVRRAQEAGFDGCQLHGAHGWLLSSFLSPRTNQRGDLYGGSTENRTRIVREIHQRARKKVGDRFPILIKFNTTDFLPGGTDLPEAIRVGKMLSEAGFDALEASGGMWEAVTRSQEELGWPPVLLPESRTGIRTPDQEAYFLSAARALKENTQATIIAVGGFRSFNRVEEALASGAADFVSLSRPLVRQPDLPWRWYSGETDKASCISCNACLPIGHAPLACRADAGAVSN